MCVCVYIYVIFSINPVPALVAKVTKNRYRWLKKARKVGAAFVATLEGEVIQEHRDCLRDHSSVFQVEVWAINAALTRLNFIKEPGIKVTICVDSQGALKALFNSQHTSPLVIQTLDLLKQDTKLQWVKAHIGIKGNEPTDQAAELAKYTQDMAFPSAI